MFTQRFDSALRLNVHFHGLWPDGVFTCSPFGNDAEFWPQDPLCGADIERLTRAVRQRVLRLLRKRGKLPDHDQPADDPATADPSLHETLGAAAVQGRIAFGENAGALDPRLGRGSEQGGEFRRGALRAESEGFSLHAGVCIPENCPARLEKLCRYAARPPIVHRSSSSARASTAAHAAAVNAEGIIAERHPGEARQQPSGRR